MTINQSINQMVFIAITRNITHTVTNSTYKYYDNGGKEVTLKGPPVTKLFHMYFYLWQISYKLTYK